MRLQVAPFRLRCLQANSARTTRTLLRIDNSRVHSPIGNVECSFGSRGRFAADWSSLSLNNRQIVRTERLRLSSATLRVHRQPVLRALFLSLPLSTNARTNERTNERINERTIGALLFDLLSALSSSCREGERKSAAMRCRCCFRSCVYFIYNY